jgi:hypothetical protein
VHANHDMPVGWILWGCMYCNSNAFKPAALHYGSSIGVSNWVAMYAYRVLRRCMHCKSNAFPKPGALHSGWVRLPSRVDVHARPVMPVLCVLRGHMRSKPIAFSKSCGVPRAASPRLSRWLQVQAPAGGEALRTWCEMVWCLCFEVSW